jgi:Spy/CpxP family protein refolding chaperone
MRTNIKQWLLIAGMAMGTLPATAQGDVGEVTRPPHGQRMEQMQADLGLTDAQVAQIKAIRERYRPERKAMREAELKDPALEARRKQMREEEQAAVKAVLTPDQQVRFEELRAVRHAHGHQPMSPEQRQYFQEQVLPTLLAQRLKLETALSTADKATVERLRGELQALRETRKSEMPRGDRTQHTPPSEADRARMEAFHAKRHAIMEEAASVAGRYMTQIKALHEEIKPQMERFRAEMEAQRPAQPAYAPAGKPRHMRDGKKQMDAAHFLLMDPAQVPGQGRKKAERTGQIGLEVFPNPAVSRATLRYAVPSAGMTKVELLDGQGKVLRVLAEGQVPAGEHFVDLDTQAMAAGTYYFRITDQAGSKVRTLKVVH